MAHSRSFRLLTAALLTTTVTTVTTATTADAKSVLFVRGADRSGGFLEADNDAERTEQLADINNNATNGGNHGWGELNTLLTTNGFDVTQINEPLEANAPTTGQTQGAPIAFDTLDLNAYDAIVFGSNNAVYTPAQIDAIDNYIRGGGGALFISDANFGSDRADAPNSDQQFLNRFGLVVNQDQSTYRLNRNDGDFLAPDNALLNGINEIDGEGVSPFEIADNVPDDVSITLLAVAEGTIRSNAGEPSRSAGQGDAAVVVAEAGQGRIVGHFDRNTFFNDNGAGTNINRFDNEAYALNVFAFLTVPEPGTAMLLAGVLPLLARRRSNG